jgi:vanillate monooxygenase
MEALRNQWYCAAFGHELGETPLGRTYLNEAVVLYRKADGTPVAFEDRCCHRRAPLSKGKVEGDNLRCGYHGFLYDPSGKVAWAPGTERLPPGARVKTYPVVEAHGWVWIWMGDPALADPATAPQYVYYDHPEWASYDQLIPLKGNYFLIVDNLLDLSHLPFLHANTIGSPEDVNPDLVWERGEDWVKGVRQARGLSPSPANAAQGLDFKFDRKQVMLFEPPSQVTIDIFQNEFGQEFGSPGDRMRRRIVIYDTATPETDTSCFYFWAIARDYRVGDAELTKVLRASTAAAFDEDTKMIAAQQRVIDFDPAARQVDVVGDHGSMQARRIMERLLAAEKGTRAAAE